MDKARRSGRTVGRVLFLYPPTRIGRELLNRCMPPLGAPYLAAMIRDEYDVALLDATSEGFKNVVKEPEGFVVSGLSLDEIERRVEAYRPDFVAITCLFSSVYPVAARVAERVKAIDPTIYVGIGGTYTNFLWQDVMTNCPHIDFIGMGEGEAVIQDLLRALNGHGVLEEVEGLVYRTEDGGFRQTPRAKMIEDLDALPFPARDLIDWDLYRGSRFHHYYTKEELVTSLVTSRGCPAKCIFCSSSHFWGRKFRARSPENVVAEIEHVVDDFGIREFSIEDDNVTLDLKRAKAIFKTIIDRGLDVSFITPNGIALWALDEELLELMRAAGVYQLTLALESGDQEVLKRIVRKPLNLERGRRLVHKAHQLGFDTFAVFIIGFPGETLAQMQKTIDYANSLPVKDASFFIANPLPGSELYAMAKANGWLKPGFSFVNQTYSRCSIEAPGWTSSQVERLANTSLFSFHVKKAIRHPVRTLGRILSAPSTSLDVLEKGVNRVTQSFIKRRKPE